MRAKLALSSGLVVLFVVALVAFILGDQTQRQSNQADELNNKTDTRISSLISSLPAQPKFESQAPGEDLLNKIAEDPFYQLPASLQDVALLYRFQTAEDGSLLLTSDIKEIFDYFLSGITEEPLDVSIARIIAYIHSSLEANANDQAQEVLLRYLSMKIRLQDFEESRHGQNVDVESFLMARNALMQEELGSEIYEVFYKDAHQYDAYTLAARRGEGESSVSGLTGTEVQLSELQARYRSSAMLHQSLDQEVKSMRTAGADKQKVFELREKTVGRDAAQRLAQLDEQRESWRQRVEVFRASSDKITNDINLSDSQKQARIQELRKQQFDQKDQIRLNVWLNNKALN